MIIIKKKTKSCEKNVTLAHWNTISNGQTKRKQTSGRCYKNLKTEVSQKISLQLFHKTHILILLQISLLLLRQLDACRKSELNKMTTYIYCFNTEGRVHVCLCRIFFYTVLGTIQHSFVVQCIYSSNLTLSVTFICLK